MSNDEQDYLWEQLEEMWPPDSKVKQSLSEEIEEFERFIRMGPMIMIGNPMDTKMIGGPVRF